jgi:hypothetical protein
MVGDDVAHGGGEAVGPERRRRMQRQPIGRVDAPADADPDAGGARGAVELGEGDGEEGLGQRRRRLAA